ncbi:phage terminase large subunit family protein [Ancylobacter sp.]|uniref:phage terminase large subunit family protein n=1 Tax=Ancylobacter sp. TaxID=1872567 RepID=UPI003BA98F64
MTEWEDANRTLPGTNAEPGPWRTARVPYLAESIDCLSTASPVKQVVLMMGAQTGGTEASLNAVGYWVAQASGLILAVWRSIDMAHRMSRNIGGSGSGAIGRDAVVRLAAAMSPARLCDLIPRGRHASAGLAAV